MTRSRGVLIVAGAMFLVAAALLTAGLVTIFGSGGGGSSHAVLDTALARARPATREFAGFTEARVAVGGRCRRLVIADTLDQRVRGLRQVDDLGPYDGMLFVYGSPSNARFTMADTRISLDIGFYDGQGRPVGRREMTPCAKPEPQCPLYGIGRTYRYALETPRGGAPSGALSSCTG